MRLPTNSSLHIIIPKFPRNFPCGWIWGNRVRVEFRAKSSSIITSKLGEGLCSLIISRLAPPTRPLRDPACTPRVQWFWGHASMFPGGMGMASSAHPCSDILGRSTRCCCVLLPCFSFTSTQCRRCQSAHIRSLKTFGASLLTSHLLFLSTRSVSKGMRVYGQMT